MSGEGFSECLIRGKSQRGVLVRLLAIFESRGINVLNCSYELDNDASTFGAVLVIELKKNSDSETLSIVEKLMDTKVVSTIEFAPVDGKFFMSFRFPIKILPQDRGVVVQPDLLIDGFLSADQRDAPSIFEAGRTYGRSFASRLKSTAKSERKLDVVNQTLKATGWGVGNYEENERGEITFTLSDPVFGIESEMERRSRFLVGLIQGMIEETIDCSLELLGDRFDGKINALVVRMKRQSSTN